MQSSQAQLLQYGEVVFVDLADNTVNFVDDIVQGHRVQVPIAIDDLNTFFQWSRPTGQDRPVGFVTGLEDLYNCLLVSFSDGFLDLDAVSTGLSYSTGTLGNDTNTSNSMNDIVLCYILYMVYGKSSFNTSGKVFNVADAFQMIDNSIVSQAICTSISNNTERGQSVDDMFRDLLKTDPKRFFDAEGQQIPGLFETHVDESHTGSWLFTAGDAIEIKLQFTFQEAVTRRVVRADQQPLTEQGIQFGEQAVEQVIIPKDATFAIRLQLLATAERSPLRLYQLEHGGGSLQFAPSAPTTIVLSQTTRARELAITYTSGNSHGFPILGNTIRVYDSTGAFVFESSNISVLTGLETKAYSITVSQQNRFGEGQVSVYSNVCTPLTTVPNPPTDIDLSQTSNGGELEATWTAPLVDGGETILGYHIQVLDSHGTIILDSIESTSPLLLQNLSASESYKVQLATQNTVGESDWSQCSTSSSPLGSIPSEPTALFLFSSSVAGELLASWNSPNQTGGLPIGGYTVYLFADPANPPIQIQSTPNTFYQFTGLHSAIQYSVKVSATNSLGDGPLSAGSRPMVPL